MSVLNCFNLLFVISADRWTGHHHFSGVCGGIGYIILFGFLYLFPFSFYFSYDIFDL